MEDLIGKKVMGFEFQPSKNALYIKEMNNYLGVIGIIGSYNTTNDTFRIFFMDRKSFAYPAEEVLMELDMTVC